WIGRIPERSEEPQRHPDFKIPKAVLDTADAATIHHHRREGVALGQSASRNYTGFYKIAPETALDSRYKSWIIEITGRLCQWKERRAVTVDKGSADAVHPHQKAGRGASRNVIETHFELQQHIAEACESSEIIDGIGGTVHRHHAKNHKREVSRKNCDELFCMKIYKKVEIVIKI